MKLAPYLLGVISAQSGDYDYGVSDGDAERHTGTTWTGFGNNNWNYGSGRALTPYTPTAVTCWESNNAGTRTENNNAFFDDTDDNFGWAHTHHGHEQSKGTVNVVGGAEMGGAIVDGDFHSGLGFDHRLSGCIYEAVGWEYTANTYNKFHLMEYGALANNHGFDNTAGTGTDIYPIWWHYFNAHTFAGGNTHAHMLAMTNPTFEGLGYLNFIVTFEKGDGAGTNFRDGEPNNVDSARHTDLYSNGDAFTLSVDEQAGCTALADLTPASTQCWGSKYSAATDQWDVTALPARGNNLAIGSFPQNDLGKDFRFNLRILHHLGEGDSEEFFDSYYFYRVDKITIVFPHTVSCANEDAHDGSGTVMHHCMDSAGFNGHQRWYHSGANGAVTNAFTEAFTDSKGDVSTFSLKCDSTSTSKHTCGATYAVTGLMNTYDEYAQQEYGTMQEIWFQFCYLFHETNTDYEDTVTGMYNYPNKLFNAFETVSVHMECTESTPNGNKCDDTVSDGTSEESWV